MADQGAAGPSRGTGRDQDPLAAAASVGAQLRREGKQVDRGLDWGLGVLAALLGSGVSALVAAPVVESARQGWVVVTLTTFTWTVGCAAIAFLALSGRLNGAPLFMGLAPAIFLGTLTLATLLGHGELPLSRDGVISTSSIVSNAVDAYGPLGAVIGVGIGWWIGSRAATAFPDARP